MKGSDPCRFALVPSGDLLARPPFSYRLFLAVGRLYDANKRRTLFDDLLGHIKQRLIMIQPKIMIGYAHLMKRHFLGILEEAVWSPDLVQPVNVEDPVFLVHVLRQT